jgi:hypothetical protein
MGIYGSDSRVRFNQAYRSRYQNSSLSSCAGVCGNDLCNLMKTDSNAYSHSSPLTYTQKLELEISLIQMEDKKLELEERGQEAEARAVQEAIDIIVKLLGGN